MAMPRPRAVRIASAPVGSMPYAGVTSAASRTRACRAAVKQSGRTPDRGTCRSVHGAGRAGFTGWGLAACFAATVAIVAWLASPD